MSHFGLAFKSITLRLYILGGIGFTYYETLGVPSDSSGDEIKAAYRRAAMASHPDRNPEDPLAEDRFKAIGEAYYVLSDRDRRHDYDENLRTAEAAGNRAKGFSKPDFDYRAYSEIFVREMADLATELTNRNVHRTKIVPELVRRGCPRSVATSIAATVEERRKNFVRSVSRKLVLRAVLAACAGIILTGLLWGIGYVALVGPLLIVSGLYNGMRALYHLVSGRVPTKGTLE